MHQALILLAANQVHLPLPLARTWVPRRRVRNELLRDGVQALQLWVAVGGQDAFGAGIGQYLRVLLPG
jgi:hypothetical protein